MSTAPAVAPSLSSSTPLTSLPASSIEATPADEIEERYEISDTLDFIRCSQTHIIALQFPDELLPDSVSVYKALRTGLDAETELYILADTTFGSCCVDEIAAQHVNAQLVIHYGHACLSPTARLPVFYVFTKRPLNIDHSVQQLAPHISAAQQHSKLLLKGDVAYDWKMAELSNALQQKLDRPIDYKPPRKTCPMRSASDQLYTTSSTGDNCGSAKDCQGSFMVPPSSSARNTARCCSTSKLEESNQENDKSVDAEKLPENSTVIWIGPSTLALTHLLMTNPSTPITIYEPSEDGSTGRVSPPSGQTNKLLMRRYAAVQRARDADVIGLVVGTLGISSYLPLVSRIRHLLRAHQKKVYTLSVGKPTPAKLANYQEVECFVLIACPENSLLLLGPETSKEFYRPMVTPWEMEVALGDGSWDQGWRLGWKEPAKKHDDDEDASENEDEDVQFSAATGKLRTVRKYAQRPNMADLSAQVNSMALQTRPDSKRELARLMGSAAGERLQDLTYQGLDPRFGLDRPAVLEQGRVGVAKGYTNEHAPS